MAKSKQKQMCGQCLRYNGAKLFPQKTTWCKSDSKGRTCIKEDSPACKNYDPNLALIRARNEK